ncbi:CU044_5270 family protein [Curtobacterium albidum]|uniref:CU044_5270 family protein n=1 Tax=Curtobacterium citreum TaxID=2036 RepID=UPI002026885B|nr:CU044_5270 family protein [Curtobacterium albidum]MCL9664648.1 CU044_5270 family protein [Curtobacterium albidum]
MITVPPPEGPALDDAVTPIRREVLARTVGHRRTRSRWTLGVVGSVAAVTALATVLVAGDLTGTTEHVPVVGSAPQAATAAEVFRRAADATVHTSDPVVGPGQYLEVDVQEQSQVFLGPDSSALVPYSLTVYRPADTSVEWTLVRTSGEPVAYFPSDRAAEVEAAWKADPAGYPTGTVRALDGAFSGDPWTPADLAAMPRDPDALYDWVAAHASGSSSHEEAMTVLVTDRLATGMVPADLRSAMYQVLARIPGATVTHDAVTLDGRTGVGIGRTEAGRGDEYTEVVVDPTTGDFIGMRSIAGRATRAFPAGTVLDSKSVTTSVVDTAP